MPAEENGFLFRYCYTLLIISRSVLWNISLYVEEHPHLPVAHRLIVYAAGVVSYLRELKRWYPIWQRILGLRKMLGGFIHLRKV